MRISDWSSDGCSSDLFVSTETAIKKRTTVSFATDLALHVRRMERLSTNERDAIARTAAAPMLEHVQAWVAINSGTANLDGLAQIAEALADAFSALPGTLRLVEPEPVEAVSATGAVSAQPHGHHLHLAVRPDAPVQMLFTGHMKDRKSTRQNSSH